MTAHKIYALTVVTCVVSEIPGKVSAVEPVSVALVRDQLEILLASFPVSAIKTGMLYSREAVEAVSEVLAALPAKNRPHIVVDPVMVATSGDPLLQKDAIAAYQDKLFPLATLLTPNMDEAAVLLGEKITTLEQLTAAAEALYAKHGAAVLMKGGHLKGRTAVDVLRDAEGTATFEAPFVPNVNTHGTGCTFSAAIAAHLALGKNLRSAVRSAKSYVTRAIRDSFQWQSPKGRVDALNHFQQSKS
jgi:hydroxymethylpyrimidine/phosphomethylpyrimidine kinase